jgi:hypothetical protein
MVLWQNIGGVDLTVGSTLNAIGLEIAFDDLPAGITIMVTDGSSNVGSSTTVTRAGSSFPPPRPFSSRRSPAASTSPT